MTNESNTSAIFAAFIEADKAIKELPEVKAKLAETEELAQSYADDLARDREEMAKLRANIAQLEADKSATEAALADATKSRDEHANLLHGLRGLLGASVPVPTEVTHETDANPVSDSSTTATETATETVATPDNATHVSTEDIAPMPSVPADIRASHTELTTEPAPTPVKAPWQSKPHWVNWNDWANLHNGEVPFWAHDMTATD